MKNPILKRLLMAGCLIASGSAAAVSLNPRGSGQVLIYPYYTVNGNHQTLLTIRNMTSQGKALRVRMREGRNGREVMQFNLYLSASDAWSAAIFSVTPSGPANLVIDDTSCTAPAIRGNPALPMLPDGRRYIPFRNDAYSGANRDAGPDTLDRTREGILEVIEMGTIPYPSVLWSWITHVNGVPANCQNVQSGFLSGGYWATDSKHGLINPSGGLSGSASIVNAYDGPFYSYNAAALERFREDVNGRQNNQVVLHTATGSLSPNLRDAISDPATGSASASVLIDERLIRVNYPADRAIDAVSAVFSAATLSNDYLVDPGLGADTDWILSFPTRPYYTDQALVGFNAIAPFTNVYPSTGSETAQCQGLPRRLFSREEGFVLEECGGGNPPPGCPKHLDMCFVTQAQTFNRDAGGNPISVLGSSLVAGGNLTSPQTAGFNGGWQQYLLGPNPDFIPTPMRPAISGERFLGLPVLGFAATRYAYNPGQPAATIFLTGALPDQSTARCVRVATDGQYTDC